jgi:hypothetical protein
MTSKLLVRPVAVLRPVAFCCLLAAFASRARAEDAAALVQKGFYLQVHEGDLAGAAAAFERVASDSAAPAVLRNEAQTRLAQCREDLASADLARLMPPEAIAYVELSRPGDQVVRLAKMMGLVQEPGAAPAAAAEGQSVPGIPLGPGLVFPANFTLSPALVAELEKFRGAALAITGLDERMKDIPEGVLVIHPGDSDLVRGLLETAVQLIEPAKPIGSFKTYRFKQGSRQFWITVTARLLIAGTDREGVAAVVDRLGHPKAASLATRASFQTHDADRRNRLVFAYVDGHELARRLRPMMKGGDAAMVSTLLDLDHLESLTFAAGVTDDSVQLVARVNLMPGHHNLPYNLIRTAPFTRRSLAAVPSGAAAVVLLGLNPATPVPGTNPAAPAPSSNSTGQPNAPVEVTGMDLGREIFANVEEVAFFVLPTAAEHAGPHTHVPEMAAVFAVKDAAKSEAIWNQILAIASLVGIHDSHPHDVTIDGKRGEQYQFHGMPPIVVVRAADRALIVGTAGAATAALHASAGKESILSDEAHRTLLSRLTPTSSKAVLVDAGRAVQIARALSGGENDSQMQMAAVALKDLRLSIVTDEAPNCLTVNIEATGLPNIPSVIKVVASQMESGKTAQTPKPGAKRAKPSQKRPERADKRPTKVSH